MSVHLQSLHGTIRLLEMLIWTAAERVLAEDEDHCLGDWVLNMHAQQMCVCMHFSEIAGDEKQAKERALQTHAAAYCWLKFMQYIISLLSIKHFNSILEMCKHWKSSNMFSGHQW